MPVLENDQTFGHPSDDFTNTNSAPLAQSACCIWIWKPPILLT